MITGIIVLAIILALISGGILGWMLQHKKVAEANSKLAANENLMIRKEAEMDNLSKRLAELAADMNQNMLLIKQELIAERDKNNLLTTKIARAEEQNIALTEKLTQQKSDLEEIQKKFTTDFENLANRILKQNTLDFAENNEKKISEILNPLKEKIVSFEKQVSETYEKGIKDQTDLKAELKKLYDLNNHISEEAHNLTKALKGDVKKQGNWGEIVLERILERSGLMKGQEYETQFSMRNDSGEMLRPDVIIKLPDNKHIIIDSKVSLIAYEQFVNADMAEEKEKFARYHVEAIKNHVKGLSEKSYAHAEALNSPDFVLMFLPIESSFSVAIQQDIELFNFAWDRRVVIVSPSTLLATLKTIESIWKREKQTQNAIEIANEGGKLYDKFVGLVEDLKKLGTQLDTVQRTYQEANKKLHVGGGNLIGKVQNLQRLGAKNSKTLPANNFMEEENNGKDEG